ncbi:MAG: hypothetical protein ACE5I7_17865 [Candidatus Binatia bacterium]
MDESGVGAALGQDRTDAVLLANALELADELDAQPVGGGGMFEPINAVIGFASGVGVSVFGALVATALQRRNEKLKRIRDTHFHTYMKLMEVQSWYRVFCMAELRREEVPADIRSKVRDLAWQIADSLRYEDNVEHLEEILRALLSSEYETASQRLEVMDHLLVKLGTVVNPRYSKIVKRISDGNVARFVQFPERHKNTPGLP